MSLLPIDQAAPFTPYNPLPGEGLNSVFQSLWTRLHEAETRATALAMQPAGSDAFEQTLRGLLQVANVRGAYQHMVDLLKAAQSSADAREADLLAELHTARRVNEELRQKLREAQR